VILGTVIEWDALGETVLAALIAGIGVALFVSLAILGATASVEASRDQRTVAATGYAALCLFGLLATAAGIVFGVVVMTTK
jgi:Mn2+/Fe2+ NRAMP family transporter